VLRECLQHCLCVSERPSCPGNVRVTSVSCEHVSVSWEHPEWDGGAALTGYVIERREADRSNWIKIATATPDRTTYKCGKLFEGATYVFRVSAENAVGVSESVEIAEPVTAKLPYCELFSPILCSFPVCL
jgi:titin